MNNDLIHIRKALVQAIAERKVADEVVDMIAGQITLAKHPIRGIDVCTYGFCIDYFFEGDELLHSLPDLIDVEIGQFKGLEIFPWGIVTPDLFRVRVTHSFDMSRRSSS